MGEAGTSPLVLSYLGLRKAIGIIGIALPFVLLVGHLVVDGADLPGSISAYYYSGMRNVLVGSLCAIAVFLLSYRYDTRDARAGMVAGVAAIGVAMFPTSPKPSPTPAQQVVGIVHLGCAAVFFLTLAYFSWFLFTKTGPGTPTRRKTQRNVVYRVCAVVIVACVVLAVLADNLLGSALVEVLLPVFWLESVAVVAFGVSWLVKGETILRDEPVSPSTGAGRDLR